MIFKMLFTTKKLTNNEYQIFDNRSGFTLVELIIYMGLLAMLVLIFTEIFTSVVDNQLSSSNTSNVSGDGRYIYSRFVYDVARAQSITDPSVFASPSSTMTLLINGENYTYQLDNGDLSIEAPSGTFQLNSQGTTISNLTFSKVGSASARSTVQLNFTVTGDVDSGGIFDQKNFQTTAGLR